MRERRAGLSGRQGGALALTAAGLPIFRLCCRVSWPWVLLGGLAAAGTLSALTAAVNRQRKAFPLRAELSGGQRDFIPSCAALPRKWVPLHRRHRASPASPMTDEAASVQRTGLHSKPAAMLFSPLLLAAALLAAWESTFSFPETAGNALAAALVLGLSAAAAWAGPAAAGRCAGILLWAAGGLYGVVLVFSLPQIDPARLRPAGSIQDALRVWAALLLPGAALCLDTGPGDARPFPHWPWWTAAGLAAAASAVTGGILSPALQPEPEAFRTLARGVSVLGVIRRFEALVNGALLMSGFALCTLYIAALASVMGIYRRRERKQKNF